MSNDSNRYTGNATNFPDSVADGMGFASRLGMATQRTYDDLEALGRLAVMMGDSRLSNRLDDNLSNSEFNAYLNGVDKARSRMAAQALIQAVVNMNNTVNIKGR